MRRWLPLVSSILVLAALAAASLARVPEGQAAASRRGWLGPGWHLRPPLAKLVRVPQSSEIELGPIEATTRTGASHQVSLTLRYRLDPGAATAPLAAAVVEHGGLPGALAPALRGALAAALGARAASPSGGAASAAPGGAAGAAAVREPASLARAGTLTDPVGAALATSLRALGIGVEELSWRRERGTPGPPVAALPPPARRKVLLVGLDAADWQIIDPMMRAGRLPNLSRLVREGARAPLRSYDPMMSPLIWTTMVTGLGPDAHGIADFLVTDGATGRTIPITSRFRKVKALWNILSDARLSSGFIGWWASYPAEPVDGYLVTDLLGFSMMAPGAPDRSAMKAITWPEPYFSEMRPRLILPDQVTYAEVARLLRIGREEFEQAPDVQTPSQRVPGAAPVAQDPVWLVRRTIAVTRNYETIALDLLGKDLDLVGVYFEGIDMMGHRFQHCMPPRLSICPEDDYRRGSDTVLSFYEYQDEVLGRLLAAAPGRTVMVVSDHGFRSGADRPPDYLPYTTGQPVEWHREYGVFVISGPGARRASSFAQASVYDIAPTLLYLSGLPAAEDMPGRVLEEAIDRAALASNPPRRIRSYEDVGAPRTLPQVADSPEAQQQMVENLQALGYVGAIETEPGAAGSTAASGGASAAGSRGIVSARVGAGSAASSGAPPGTKGAPGLERGPPTGTERQGPQDSISGAGRAASGSRPESTRVTYHRNLATFYMKSGRLAEAEAELQQANLIQPLPKSYELLSEIRAAHGDFDGAVDVLEKALGTFPEMDQEAVLWAIDLRLRQGRPDLAAGVLDRWRARLSRPALVAACEGTLQAARGEEESAIASLLEALRHEPALVQAALTAAPLLDDRGRISELESPVRRALASERRIDEYQNLLGVILLKSRRPGQALEAIGAALEVDPLNPRFLENYASAALASGKGALALDRYRLATSDPRAGGSVWSGYGRLLGLSKHPSDAASAFERAVSLGDRSAATIAGYATALLQSGRRDLSREIIREGLRAYPDDPTLKALLGR